MVCISIRETYVLCLMGYFVKNLAANAKLIREYLKHHRFQHFILKNTYWLTIIYLNLN